MFEVKNNILKITKGDTGSVKVNITYNGQPYTMQTGDVLRFTARKTPDSEVLMQVESSTDTLQLPPAKTASLIPGPCSFDIELTTANGDKFTVVGPTDRIVSNMFVYSEVTY